MIHKSLKDRVDKAVERTRIKISYLFDRFPDLEIQDLEDTLDRALCNLEEDYIGEFGGELDES